MWAGGKSKKCYFAIRNPFVPVSGAGGFILYTVYLYENNSLRIAGIITLSTNWWLGNLITVTVIEVLVEDTQSFAGV